VYKNRKETAIHRKSNSTQNNTQKQNKNTECPKQERGIKTRKQT
jgi:hypothetical protein